MIETLIGLYGVAFFLFAFLLLIAWIVAPFFLWAIHRHVRAMRMMMEQRHADFEEQRRRERMMAKIPKSQTVTAGIDLTRR